MDITNIKADFILYHTDGCHLCELAANVLCEANARFVYQDICETDNDSQELVVLYGERIPVVKAIKTSNEIGWPFTLHNFIDFMGANIESGSNK